MRKLTIGEMRVVQGGRLDLLGCASFGSRELCCMDCGGSIYCGAVEWYFTVDPPDGMC